MATNFRLEAKQSGNYSGLFPITNDKAIVGADNVLNIVTMPLRIDPPSGNVAVQDIAIVTDAKLLDSPFECYLTDKTVEAQKAYATISQMQVVENTLKITRIGAMPQTAINVVLVFYKKGGS